MIKKKSISKCHIKILEKVKSGAGFTLIELLIVIVIIGVLATITMVNFIGVRQRSRDAQRKADLRQIQSAIEFYKADQADYPPMPLYSINCSDYTSSSYSSIKDTEATVTYLEKIPCDPSGTPWYNNGNYYYLLSGNTYTLRACIENSNDTDQNVVDIDIALGCSSQKGYELTNP